MRLDELALSHGSSLFGLAFCHTAFSPKHCMCSLQHKPMARFSVEESFNSAASPSLASFVCTFALWASTLPRDGLSIWSSSWYTHLAVTRKESLFRRRSVVSLLAHSARYGHQSGFHEAHCESSWIVKLLKVIFHVPTARGFSPRRSELLTCCTPHSSSFPGGDALGDTWCGSAGLGCAGSWLVSLQYFVIGSETYM